MTTELLPADDAPAVEAKAAATAPTASEALSERLFEGAIAMIELTTIHLGLRLGLYAALRDHGPANAAQLATRTGTDQRYIREWLEQQAMALLVDCPVPGAAPDERSYELPASTAGALLDEHDPGYLGPVSHLAVGTVLTIRALEEAFRTGAGVPFGAYGVEVRHGLGDLNGATYTRELANWIAAMSDIDRRLRTGTDPRILDVGCGTGRSTLALARAYTSATVRGLDLDPASIHEARESAAREGLADRVSFAVQDAAEPPAPDEPGYDLITILEALHDMGDPVGALAAGRQRLRPDGAVLVADELTRDSYVPDGDPMERFQYGCSVLHCLPATRAENHVIAHGNVIRAETVEAWAGAAGFGDVQVLDIEDPFWRFYRL